MARKKTKKAPATNELLEAAARMKAPPPIPTPKSTNALVATEAAAREGAVEDLEEVDRELLGTLNTSKDEVDLAQASMQLMARRLAREITSGKSDGKAVESLKRSVEELRRAKQSFVDLARERGELIERDVGKACMGQLADRFVKALERVEAGIAAQVDAWWADPAFQALETDVRRRAVRAWIAGHTRAARVEEAAELERMVAAEVADRLPAAKKARKGT